MSREGWDGKARGRQNDREPFWVWPDARQRRRLGLALLGLSLLFAIVYGGAEFITSLRTTRYPVHFSFELSLPFVPELSLVYSSVYLMFGFIALTLPTKDRLNQFVAQMVLMTLIAGVCFLIYPAELAFETPEVVGWAALPFRWADRINLTYNCAPSLHVAYASLCAATMWRRRRVWGIAFCIWAIAIAVSAWLTYQHHLVDLITGGLLGVWTARQTSLHRILTRR
ncbi:phosphatase PAP2 family protein [Stieleria sp.]|uniref:phosphatase PAP2 family protein n=1 Tax=Stieleria sp. TaxID=2795976 RepID=UPI0035665481